MTDQLSSSNSGFDFQKAMFSFDGRLRRSHFWIAWLILFAIGFVVGMVPVINMLGIVLLWPHLAIGVKRLHDMGKPGWLIAIPYVGWIVVLVMMCIDGTRGPNRFGADPKGEDHSQIFA